MCRFPAGLSGAQRDASLYLTIICIVGLYDAYILCVCVCVCVCVSLSLSLSLSLVSWASEAVSLCGTRYHLSRAEERAAT